MAEANIIPVWMGKKSQVHGNEQFPHSFNGPLLCGLPSQPFARTYYAISRLNWLWGRAGRREGNAGIQGRCCFRFSLQSDLHCALIRCLPVFLRQADSFFLPSSQQTDAKI